MSPILDGIPLNNISTPRKDSRIDVITIDKSFKSPFQRFGSLRIGNSDSPKKRFNKLRGSIKPGGYLYNIDSIPQNTKVVDEPIASKQELITNSQLVSKTKVGSIAQSNPFDDLEDLTEGDSNSSNPFVLHRNDTFPDLDETNPFLASDISANNKTGSSLSLSKTKRFRKSFKKTFNRIGSIRKDKKAKVDTFDFVDIKSADTSLTGEKESTQIPNDTTRDLSTSDISTSHAKLQRSLSSPVKPSLKINTPAKYEVVKEELAYQIIEIQVIIKV